MPHFFVDPPSNYDSLGPLPWLVTGILRHVLTTHFSDADGLFLQQLKNRIWSNNEQTKIVIESTSVLRAVLAGQRPAILIRRDEWQSVKTAIGNVAGMTDDGHFQYTKDCTGSHVLFCISKADVETEILAAEVYKYLLHFSPEIRCRFGFKMFELAKIGQLGILKEATDRFVVPITVVYGFSENWTLQQHAAPLKTIRFEGEASGSPTLLTPVIIAVN